MAIRRLEKRDWQVFFDGYSRKTLQDDQPEYGDLRLLSKELGNVQGTTWLPILGITYDPSGDVLEVQLEDLDHMIQHPREIYIDEDDRGVVQSLEVVQKGGDKQIIEIR